jgi:hypothetical protein
MNIILTESQYNRLVENESFFDFEVNLDDVSNDNEEGRCTVLLKIWEDNAKVDDYVEYAIEVDFECGIDHGHRLNLFVTEFWPTYIHLIYPERSENLPIEIAQMYLSDYNIQRKIGNDLDASVEYKKHTQSEDPEEID